MNLKFLSSLFFVTILSFSNAQTVTTLVQDNNKTFEAIHWHPDGRIYAVDYNNGRLYQVFLDGNVETLVTGIPNMAGGGFDEDGNFYFSGLAAGRVYRLEADGNVKLIASGLDQPTGIIAFDSQNLLVGQYRNNSIAKVNIASGTVENWISGKGLNGPDGIIHYNEDEFLVANFNNSEIHLVDTDGKITDFARLPVHGFMGYITYSDGYVYASSFAGHLIYRIDEEEVLVLAGNGIEGNANGNAMDASFSRPNGIVGSPNGDTLLVTDATGIRMITNLKGSVSVEEANNIQEVVLRPNPIQEKLSLSFNIISSERMKWRIVDARGQIVLESERKLYQAGNHDLTIEVDQLEAGNYWISLTNGHAKQQIIPFIKI